MFVRASYLGITSGGCLRAASTKYRGYENQGSAYSHGRVCWCALVHRGFRLLLAEEAKCSGIISVLDLTCHFMWARKCLTRVIHTVSFSFYPVTFCLCCARCSANKLLQKIHTLPQSPNLLFASPQVEPERARLWNYLDRVDWKKQVIADKCYLGCSCSPGLLGGLSSRRFQVDANEGFEFGNERLMRRPDEFFLWIESATDSRMSSGVVDPTSYVTDE